MTGGGGRRYTFIRKLRENKKMTQEELAEVTYIPKPTISNYENDRIDIKSSVIAELANALQTDPNYLILGEKATKADDGFMNEAAELFSGFVVAGVDEIRCLAAGFQRKIAEGQHAAFGHESDKFLFVGHRNHPFWPVRYLTGNMSVSKVSFGSVPAGSTGQNRPYR